MLNYLKFIHLFALVVWVGSLFFFSFFVAPGVFKALPRESAGELIGVIFRKYWLIGYAGSVLGLVSLLVISFIEKSFPTARIAVITLMALLTFYNGLSVAAKAREAKQQAHMVQEGLAKEVLAKEFKRLHKASSALNAIVIVLGVVFIFLTSRCLRL